MQPIDLSSELPPRRDDEPSSLRADIFDELLDHLECSYQRERVKTSNETIAQRNVLAKFGNPASIAFRLWRDAMWEKLMLQRILSVGAIACAVAALAVSVFLWNEVKASRQMQAAQLTEMRQFFESMLQKATTPAPAAPPVDPGTVDVIVKLMNEADAPVAGKVALMTPAAADQQRGRGVSRDLNGGVMLGEKEEDDGEIVFTNVPYGRYRVRVQVPAANQYLVRDVFVRPGESTVEIICPPPAPPPQSVSVVLNPPDDIKDFPGGFIVEVSGQPRLLREPGTIWRPITSYHESFAFDAKGTFLGSIRQPASSEFPASGDRYVNLVQSQFEHVVASDVRAEAFTYTVNIVGKFHGPLPNGSLTNSENFDLRNAGENDIVFLKLQPENETRQFQGQCVRSEPKTEIRLNAENAEGAWNRVRTIQQSPRSPLSSFGKLKVEDGFFVEVSQSGVGGVGSRGRASRGGGGSNLNVLPNVGQ